MKDNLAYEEERWEEVIDGKIMMMSPASLNHNRVVGNIFSLFNHYLKGRTCEAFSDGVALYLTDNGDYYIPDVMVVCDPGKVKDDGVHGAPDLVVEILSPRTTKNDRGRKKDDYEKCLRRKWFYVKNGYVDQKIPYPDEDNHRFDIHMNGYGIGYIELMAMLNKVNMFINSLIGNGRYNL